MAMLLSHYAIRIHTNLKELSLQADILIAALGKPGFVKNDMVKENAVVIDVGITRVEDSTAKKGFRIKGDVDFDECCTKNIIYNTGSWWRWFNDDCRIT